MRLMPRFAAAAMTAALVAAPALSASAATDVPLVPKFSVGKTHLKLGKSTTYKLTNFNKTLPIVIFKLGSTGGISSKTVKAKSDGSFTAPISYKKPGKYTLLFLGADAAGHPIFKTVTFTVTN